MSHFHSVKEGYIYYKEWGNSGGKDYPPGEAIVFCHGWPLSSDEWESQMFFFAEKGYHVIALDRRGFGRSNQPAIGNDVNTYAEDLDRLLRRLGVKNATLVGHSIGGGEIARYFSAYGTECVSKAVLVSSNTPLIDKGRDNPHGLPFETLQEWQAAMVKDRAQFFLDIASGPYYGYNRFGAQPSQGKIWNWWRQAMQSGLFHAYEGLYEFWVNSFEGDLKRMDIPVLLLHGDDDQIAPIDATARRAIKLLKNGTLKEIKGGPHGLPSTHADEVNKAILEFIEGKSDDPE